MFAVIVVAAALIGSLILIAKYKLQEKATTELVLHNFPSRPGERLVGHDRAATQRPCWTGDRVRFRHEESSDWKQDYQQYREYLRRGVDAGLGQRMSRNPAPNLF